MSSQDSEKLSKLISLLDGRPQPGRVLYWQFYITARTLKLPIFPDATLPWWKRLWPGFVTILLWLAHGDFWPAVSTAFLSGFSPATEDAAVKHYKQAFRDRMKEQHRLILGIYHHGIHGDDARDLLRAQQETEAEATDKQEEGDLMLELLRAIQGLESDHSDHGDKHPAIDGQQAWREELAAKNGLTLEQLDNIMDNERCDECPATSCPSNPAYNGTDEDDHAADPDGERFAKMVEANIMSLFGQSDAPVDEASEEAPGQPDEDGGAGE